MHRMIADIGDFIFVEDIPEPCDIIITVGGSYPQIPEKAAELYKAGFAPYVLAGGKYSVKTKHFKGVSDKADLYDGIYPTECDFYFDVLVRNGVPADAILREDQSGFTRQNAEFARIVTDQKKLSVRSAIVVCKRFHARRCLMFFQSAYPEADIQIVPADIEKTDRNLNKYNWYQSQDGIQRVLGELSRCGSQIDAADITVWQKGKEEAE